MTEKELSDLERRAEKASPGPWTCGVNLELTHLCDSDKRRLWTGTMTLGIFNSQWVSREQNEANADFAGEARTDIPALCSALREAWAKLAEKDAEIERLRMEVAKHKAAALCDDLESWNQKGYQGR